MFTLFADIYPTLILAKDGPFGGSMVVAALITPYMISAYIKKYNIKVSSITGILITIIPLFLEYVFIRVVLVKSF